MNKNTPTIMLVTGERKAGKSTLCRDVCRQLRSKDVTVTGLITEQPLPHTLVSTDLRSGQQYTLTLPFGEDQGIGLSHFRIDPEAMARSAEGLQDSFPTQVFIIDELGPLELVRDQGWVEALTLLDRNTYDVALLVVRPALVNEALRKLPGDWYTVIHLTPKNRETVRERLVQEILSHLYATAS